MREPCPVEGAGLQAMTGEATLEMTLHTEGVVRLIEHTTTYDICPPAFRHRRWRKKGGGF